MPLFPFLGQLDENKILDVDRGLRDVRADLTATRRRLGIAPEDGSWLPPSHLEGMEIGLDVLVKIGRKAMSQP